MWRGLRFSVAQYVIGEDASGDETYTTQCSLPIAIDGFVVLLFIVLARDCPAL